MIVFDYRLPSPALREYVKMFQIIGFEFGNTMNVPSKPYWPRPENCLTFYPRDRESISSPESNKAETKPRSALIGQPSFVTHRQVGRDFVLFQIVFQPGALFRITGIPANKLTNSFIDAEAVFSNEIGLVNERLSSTNNHLEMVMIVEKFLTFLIKRAKYAVRPVDKIGSQMMVTRNVSLDKLASDACLSRKQFYRNFVDRMGVSPKLYSRIIQFDQVMKVKNANPQKSWFSIAVDMGYYDYQHLAKDFKEFTGLSPAGFYNQDLNAPERTFGHIET